MVAVIKTGHSLRRILNYNENKVTEGKAQCIGQGNYPMETHQMNFAMRHNRLARQAELNPNVSRNSVHISLNFDTIEKDMEKEKLMSIAHEYMQRIGFGKQPYLVYQHYDAAHPHIHIVSVKIKSDGKRIDMQNIGRNQSENARKLIEKKYGLVEAARDSAAAQKTAPPLAKAVYGKNDTLRTITNIVDAVIPNYKFTSLPELNAVLRQYNIVAERGSEKSRVFKYHGLMYRILDEKGNKAGVPIKASSIYSKPTLAFLEKQFPLNETARSKFKGRLKNAIDSKLSVSESLDISKLSKALEKEGISIVLRQSNTGLIYGITYVDHSTKCVFNGSSLGKPYSAQGITQRCGSQEKKEIQEITQVKTSHSQSGNPTGFSDSGKAVSGILEQTVSTLFKTENAGDYMPKRYKKRKKRRGHSDNG